ncbi:hypothetical protein G8J22_02365 [Lentilactobacillus hilgardii]|uniref:phage baseplate plug family protein n=1 Tax=Lentilactobacillus hilgardii TaxID=1588 RepID=UPI00019C5E0B|nr:hypothetical protein [Lentilactobacillus hilgardii]EEI19568.1 hypothetical protein HMPREF0497_1639 [Lentilactobacillus buchneri ATCC 11577]QIR10357.1 hypothetical protein G8J22_02365 [Lentilactobacillus hilgardii]
MSLRDKLIVNKDSLPEDFTLPSGTDDFELILFYRPRYDNFYFDLYDANGEPLIKGEKLVYGMPLWNINDTRLPTETIIPMDESGIETDVSWDNFQESVFLYYDDLDPSLTDPDYSDNSDDENDDLTDEDDSDDSLIEDEPQDDNNPYALPDGGESL